MPDYTYVRQLFRDLFISSGYRYDFQWDWIEAFSNIGAEIERNLHHSRNGLHSKVAVSHRDMYGLKNSSEGTGSTPQSRDCSRGWKSIGIMSPPSPALKQKAHARWESDSSTTSTPSSSTSSTSPWEPSLKANIIARGERGDVRGWEVDSWEGCDLADDGKASTISKFQEQQNLAEKICTPAKEEKQERGTSGGVWRPKAFCPAPKDEVHRPSPDQRLRASGGRTRGRGRGGDGGGQRGRPSAGRGGGPFGTSHRGRGAKPGRRSGRGAHENGQ